MRVTEKHKERPALDVCIRDGGAILVNQLEWTAYRRGARIAAAQIPRGVKSEKQK